MARSDFVLGYLLGRRDRRGGWTPGPRKRPKMPSGLWRFWALVCFGLGALAAWLLFRQTDAVVLRTLVGGGLGMAIGMIVVETIWERRTPPGDGPGAPTS